MRRIIIFVLIFAYCYFLFLSLRSVLWGGIPFWSDPARDLLLAWDNLHKISLIGPPGGIPGVFYGPYWLWLNSLVLVFTKDPRFCSLFVILIPYFTLFPLLFWKLGKFIGRGPVVLIWLIFMLAYGSFYTTFIWQPYLVPILLAALVYISASNILNKPLMVGIMAAMLVNFHLSFGIVTCLSVSLLFFVTWLVKDRKIKTLILYIAGILIVFLPFLLFESRHGFNQTQSFIKAFINSAVYNSASVGQMGLTKPEILSRFLSIPAQFLQMPFHLVVILWLALITQFKNKFTRNQIGIIAFLLFNIIGLFVVFYTSKNPVWDYYFIGMETLFLLLMGVLISKSRVLLTVGYLWVLILASRHLASFIRDPGADFLAVPSLASKQLVTQTIIDDAANQPFTVFAYSPSIYTFDYDYLFKWLAPNHITGGPVFLIIPPETSIAVKEDFIHYKTPGYITVWEKVQKDKTMILKQWPK
ncbi:MAG: hypothetical protein AAB838_01080 [Patescibacteria group bacterium]